MIGKLLCKLGFHQMTKKYKFKGKGKVRISTAFTMLSAMCQRKGCFYSKEVDFFGKDR